MARLIVADTSTRATGVGLYVFDPDHPESGVMRSKQVVEQNRMHAEGLLTVMDALFAPEKIAPHEVDGFVVALGPGSFTGLRIGVTMMKTMAQFTRKPVFGISTLEALAREGERAIASIGERLSEQTSVVAPIIDARGKRLYAGLKKTGGDWILPEDLYFEEDFWNQFRLFFPETSRQANPVRIIWAGEGISLHPSLSERFAPYEQTVLSGEASQSPLVALGELGAIRFARGDSDSVLDLVPHYLRRSQAEMDRSTSCPH